MLQKGVDAGVDADARMSRGRLVLGMPGRVWTMALWFAGVSMLLLFSLIVPLDASAQPTLRAALMVYAAASAVALMVLKDRVATWFIHVQVAVGIVASLLLVWASVTPVGAITAANSLIVVAAYVGFWMARRVALVYVTVFCCGLLAVFGVGGNLPSLLVPWAFVSTMSVGLVLSFGTLVHQMNRQLVTDPLTGLLNRTGMFMLVQQRGGPNRLPAPRCLMVIDLDHFKAINDRRGHLAGDRILRDFGAALLSVARPGDVVIRSGGDEFVLILPRTSLADVDAVVSDLRAQMTLTWSVGVTEWAAEEEIDVAWARADAQMYRNKAARPARPD